MGWMLGKALEEIADGKGDAMNFQKYGLDTDSQTQGSPPVLLTLFDIGETGDLLYLYCRPNYTGKNT